MSAREKLVARVRDGLATAFGRPTTLTSYAPGRVNLIGEHTDYNDGFVLPCAIDLGTAVALAPRADRLLRIVALDQAPREHVIDLARPVASQAGWPAYVRGMAALLAPPDAAGAELVIAGDLPQGAGLSSSASVELAVGAVLAAHWGIDVEPTALAKLGQRTEHEFAGCACGIMDQLVIARAEAGAALLIDCRSLDCTPVPVPADVAVVIVDSGIERGLVDSAYNERRRQCEAVARHYGVTALRDLDEGALPAGRSALDAVAHRRARHVVTENARTLQAAHALRRGDLRQLGELMAASHASMRDDFAITLPAIDDLVALAQRTIGEAGGARMTGGGFGGCIVALCPRERVPALTAAIAAGYRTPAGTPAMILIATPSGGAALVG